MSSLIVGRSFQINHCVNLNVLLGHVLICSYILFSWFCFHFVQLKPVFSFTVSTHFPFPASLSEVPTRTAPQRRRMIQRLRRTSSRSNHWSGGSLRCSESAPTGENVQEGTSHTRQCCSLFPPLRSARFTGPPIPGRARELCSVAVGIGMIVSTSKDRWLWNWGCSCLGERQTVELLAR
jgi:hypothetical protein